MQHDQMSSIQDFNDLNTENIRSQLSQLRNILNYINTNVTQTKKQKIVDENNQGVLESESTNYVNLQIQPKTYSKQELINHRKPKFHPTLRRAFRQCKKIIEELMKHEFSEPFLRPVDPVALKIPDYLLIIKKPMDLGTIKQNLENDRYSSIKEFSDDTRLIWQNAMSYNHPKSGIYKMAQTLSIVFEEKLPKVLSIADQTPAQRKKELELKISELHESIDTFKNELKELRANGLSAIRDQKQKVKYKRHQRTAEPMTFEEKANLTNAINNLPPQYLSGIFSIIDEEIPNALKTGTNEVELDIDSLDAYVLRRMESYIKTFPSF